MAKFNPDFWEVPTDYSRLSNVPESRALWYETETDRNNRHAMKEFYTAVASHVREMIDRELTPRQREVLLLYYFYGKSQEDIAAILQLTQSTVSRHLFGTVRNGKKVGGAIPKLRKVIERSGHPAIHIALNSLQENLREAA